MQWCVLSDVDDSDHYKLISNRLQSGGIQNTFEFFQVAADTFKEKVGEVTEKYDCILLGQTYFRHVSPLIGRTTLRMAQLNAIDALVKTKDGSIWPYLFTDKAIMKWISKECPEVNVTGPAFIVGSGGLARAIVAGLVQAGFTQFVIADLHDEKMNSLVEDLKKLYFNLDFRICKKDEISLLLGVHTICINTLPIMENVDLFRELFYCNFVKKGGVVLDTNRHPIDTLFLRLSKGIAAKIYSGHQFWAYHDELWIKDVFKFDLDVQKHSEELRELFSKRPFDDSRLNQILDL